MTRWSWLVLLAICFISSYRTTNKLKGVNAFRASSFTSSDRRPNGGVDLLQPLLEYNFTFSFWDPFHQHVTVNRTVDLVRSSAVDIADEICRRADDDLASSLPSIDPTAIYRCLMPTLMTIRLTKLEQVSRLCRYYEPLPRDEEIFGLLSGYAEINRLKNEKERLTLTRSLLFNEDRDAVPFTFTTTEELDENECEKDQCVELEDERIVTACIIGMPTAHLVLPALLSEGISRVIVFSSWFDDTHDTHTRYKEGAMPWNLQYSNDIAGELDKTVEYIGLTQLMEDLTVNSDGEYNEEYRNQCSVVQLNSDYQQELVILQHTIPSLRIGDLLTHLITDKGTVMSIGFRIDTTINNTSDQHPVYQDDNSWEIVFSITWYKNTLVSMIGTQNGRLILDAEKQYTSYFPRNEDENGNSILLPHASIVKIGRMRQRVNTHIDVPNTHNNSVPHDNGTLFLPSDYKNSVIILITTSMRIFIENCFGLQYILQKQLGYTHVYVAVEINIPLYTTLQDEADRLGGVLIHIVLSSLDMTPFGRHAIVYNSEQIVYSAVYDEGKLRYYSLLYDRQYVMWSYDSLTTQYWKEIVFSSSAHNHIYHVPYCYSLRRIHILQQLFPTGINGTRWQPTNYTTATSLLPGLSESSLSTILHNRLPLSQFVSVTNPSMPLFSQIQIDAIHRVEDEAFHNHQYVLFMGSRTQRRHNITQSLEFLFIQSHLHNSLSELIKFYNFYGKLILDYTRDYYLYNSKIIINIASSTKSVLETHRINYLLSLRKVIVSEKGSDLSIIERYSPAVIFVDVRDTDGVQGAEELFDVLKRLLTDDEMYEKQQALVNEFYEQVLMRECEVLTEIGMEASISQSWKTMI